MTLWSQLLGHKGRPAWAQHSVILPWSKSTTENPDRPGAARAACHPHTALQRSGVSQLGISERRTKGVMDKGLS